MDPNVSDAEPRPIAARLPRRLHGVSLAQYAGVRAGLAEGARLEDVLANERVAPERWPRAEMAWQERIADDETEALQEEHDRLLALAQDRYGRAVAPLDDDLAAWLAVVRGFGSHEEPLAWLTQLGLRHTDVIRLHRAWSRRLADDPSLQRRAQAILSAEPGEIPPIVTGETKLAPPPDEAGDAVDEDDEDEADAAEDDAGEDEREEAEEGEEAVAFFAPLPGEEEVRADRAAPPAAAPAPRERAPAAPPIAAADLPAAEETAPPQPSFLKQPATPFVTPPGAVVVHAAPPVSLPVVKPAPPGLGSTALGLTSPVREALPFAAKSAAPAPAQPPPTTTAAPVPPAAPAPPRPMPPVVKPASGLNATAIGATSPVREALPFAAKGAPPAATPLPKVMPIPKQLGSTVDAVVSPFAAALPFAAKEAAAPPRPPPAATPPAPSPPAPSPPAPPRAPEPVAVPAPRASEPAAAPPPRAPEAAAPPADAIAGLTLHQYASLCVELQLFPHAVEAVFARYKLVTRQERLRVDLSWQEHLRRSPAVYAEWQRLYQHFTAFWSDPKNPHPGRKA
jgi:hypothetical protein